MRQHDEDEKHAVSHGRHGEEVDRREAGNVVCREWRRSSESATSDRAARGRAPVRPAGRDAERRQNPTASARGHDARQVALLGDCLQLELWTMETDTMTVLLDEPWSQVVPDIDGHVVVYQDSQAAGESYWTRQRSDLRIVDRDSGTVRVVMPLDTYYGVGIWERWIAFNNYGMYGDSLIICDLVEGGYMDSDLHVVPE
jgi:hypothetical protein